MSDHKLKKAVALLRKLRVSKLIEELEIEDIHLPRIIAVSVPSEEGKIVYHLKITPKGKLVLL